MHMAQQGCRRTAISGFTLIELLVSMAILMIIVLIVSRIFQEARTTWDVGTQKAEINMRGRGVVNYIAQELSMAVGPNYGNIGGNKAVFAVLGDAHGASRALYGVTNEHVAASSRVLRNGEPMCDNIKALDFKLIEATAVGGPPLGVEVKVTVTSEVETVGKVFVSMAYFENRSRDEADKPDAP